MAVDAASLPAEEVYFDLLISSPWPHTCPLILFTYRLDRCGLLE